MEFQKKKIIVIGKWGSYIKSKSYPWSNILINWKTIVIVGHSAGRPIFIINMQHVICFYMLRKSMIKGSGKCELEADFIDNCN